MGDRVGLEVGEHVFIVLGSGTPSSHHSCRYRADDVWDLEEEGSVPLGDSRMGSFLGWGYCIINGVVDVDWLLCCFGDRSVDPLV